MAENKTRPTDADAHAFVALVTPERRRKEAATLLSLMQRITGEPPVMWGPGIVGFGQYHYRYASGREGDFFLTGFAPRKSALTVYIVPGFKLFQAQMERLGKLKTGRSCLYVPNLARIDLNALEELIERSVVWMRQKYVTDDG